MVPPQLTASLVGFFLGLPTCSSPCETNVVSNLIIVGEVFLNETNETSEIKNVLKTFWETKSVGMVDGINPKISCQLRSSETKKHPSTVSTTKLDCRVRRIVVKQLWNVRNTSTIIALQTEEGSEFID